MTTNRVPFDAVETLLADARTERERLQAKKLRTVMGQVVEDLSGVRGGWHLQTPQAIRDSRTSRGCRTCLAKARFKSSAC